MYRFLTVLVFSAVMVISDGQAEIDAGLITKSNFTRHNDTELKSYSPRDNDTENAFSQAEIFLPCSVNEIKPSEEMGCKGLEFGKKYLISDNGGMLARCSGCGNCSGGAYDEAVTTNGSLGDSFAQWTFEPVGGACIIKSDIEAYLGRCYRCWSGAKYDQSVFNHVSSEEAKKVSYSRWRVEKYGDKVAFKSDDWGTYMARCYNCLRQGDGAESNFAFVHATTPEGPALWNVKCV